MCSKSPPPPHLPEHPLVRTTAGVVSATFGSCREEGGLRSAKFFLHSSAISQFSAIFRNLSPFIAIFHNFPAIFLTCPSYVPAGVVRATVLSCCVQCLSYSCCSCCFGCRNFCAIFRKYPAISCYFPAIFLQLIAIGFNPPPPLDHVLFRPYKEPNPPCQGHRRYCCRILCSVAVVLAKRGDDCPQRRRRALYTYSLRHLVKTRGKSV